MTFAAGGREISLPPQFFVRHISRSAHYCGVNVPAETGEMSRSDKRGATLPKVAAVAMLLIRRLTLTRLKLSFRNCYTIAIAL